MTEVTYTHWTPKPVKISRAELEAAERRLQWPMYEVDPEWAAFCQFGPDDIGSVWEELGVIRKRAETDWPRMRSRVIRKIAQMWAECLRDTGGHSSHSSYHSGKRDYYDYLGTTPAN